MSQRLWVIASLAPATQVRARDALDVRLCIQGCKQWITRSYKSASARSFGEGRRLESGEKDHSNVQSSKPSKSEPGGADGDRCASI